MNSEDIAKLLEKDEVLSLLRSLQSLGVLGGDSKIAAQKENAPRPILDWKETQIAGELTFQRSGMYRCKPKIITSRHPGTLRIVLFGESMAAGFPLAPAFTPAAVLEEILQKINNSANSIEVIDLSMPNMGPSEQLYVAEAARQINPDICLFLTGNNWYYGLSVEPTASPEARVKYANHMTENGVRGLAQAFREQLTLRAKTMVKALSEIAESAGAKAIFAIPAANHDWERRTPVPWLGKGRTKSWFTHYLAAEQFLQKADYESALQEAFAMENLEGRLSGTSQRIYVRAFLGLGQKQEARDAAMRAIDDANWQNYTWALPQVPSYVAEAIKLVANERGCPCIDLENIFAEHTDSPFLDFRMFYDHCHLSVEGISVAMAAIASILSPLITGKNKTWKDLLHYVPKPSSLIAASATFQAAHWLSQFYPEIVKHDIDQRRLIQMLEESVCLDKQFVSVLIDNVKVKSIACSPTLHAHLPKALSVPGVGAPLTSKRLNTYFLRALLNVLKKSENSGVDADAVFDHVIATYQQQLEDGIDITEPNFRDWFWERTPLAKDDPYERQGSPYYSALWPESYFSFLTSAELDLELHLVARSTQNEPLQVLLNNDVIMKNELQIKWSSHQISIPKKNLQKGINTICLRWPIINFDDEKATALAEHRFRLGIDANIFPIFGEVYSLRVQTIQSSEKLR